MKKYIFPILVLILLSELQCAKKESPDILVEFLKDLQNPKNANDLIVSKYFPKDISLNEILSLQLQQLRQSLSNCNSEVLIKHFSEARKENSDVFFNIEDSDLDQIYFIVCSSNNPIAVKLNSSYNKIISVSTLNKGGKRFFIPLK